MWRGFAWVMFERVGHRLDWDRPEVALIGSANKRD